MKLRTLSLLRTQKNAQLPDHFNNLEVFELIKLMQKNEFHLSYDRYFTEKKMFEKTPDCKFSNAEKQEFY